MSRDLTAATLTEVLATVKRPVLFYEGEFATGFLRLWSGVGTIAWNGQTWTGAGKLAGLSPITETDGVRATGLRMTLSGIDPAVISTVLAEARRHKPGRLWLGFLDAADQVVADPALAFEGRLDAPEIDDQGETATISISYESRLIDLERPRERRWTHEDQQIDFPGDLGFEYVPSIQEWNGKWGVG